MALQVCNRANKHTDGRDQYTDRLAAPHAKLYITVPEFIQSCYKRISSVSRYSPVRQTVVGLLSP